MLKEIEKMDDGEYRVRRMPDGMTAADFVACCISRRQQIKWKENWIR